jgi:hypothetical protein
MGWAFQSAIAVAALAASQLPAAALAADVTWDKIAGRRITVVLHQTRKVEIDEGTFTDKHQWTFVLSPGAANKIRYSRQDSGVWLDRPGNHKPNPSSVSTFDAELGKPHATGQAGTAIWTFEPGRLTRLSVETVGTKGRTFVIAFAERDGALSCKADIDEVGIVGAAGKTWVNREGKKRRLAAIVSQSTTCKVG